MAPGTDKPLSTVQLRTALLQTNKELDSLRGKLESERAAARQAQDELISTREILLRERELSSGNQQIASKKLEDALDLMSRLKLAATSASDSEIKLSAELDALRKVNADLLAKLRQLELPNTDNQEQLKRMKEQIAALLAENQRLAQFSDEAQSDNKVLFERIESSEVRAKEAVAAAIAVSSAQHGEQLKELNETTKLAVARVASLSAQIDSNGKLEVLAPDQIGRLMSGFLQRIESGMPSLRLAEGELKLKLGLARSAQQEGFVILPPNASAEMRSSVHEISLRFDRSGALTTIK
jgi:chromosome segregation ATPase